MNKNNILIIAPHADDEVLGCGGMISKFNNKNNIYILILTNAAKGNSDKYSENYILNLRKEALKAHQSIGIKKTFFEDFPAPMLDQIPSYLISDTISNYLKKIKPTKVFLPFYGDTHIDHKITYEASIVALRPFINKQVDTIFCYETLSETEFGIQKNNYFFNPNYFVSLSKKDISNKIKLLKFYKSQIKNYPHPRSIKGIEILSLYRGLMSYNIYAEAFMKIREYD